MKLYKTTVAGIGPFCVEFPDDGEIITTRSEARQRLIGAAQELYEALDAFRMAAAMDNGLHPAWRIIYDAACAALAKARGGAEALPESRPHLPDGEGTDAEGLTWKGEGR